MNTNLENKNEKYEASSLLDHENLQEKNADLNVKVVVTVVNNGKDYTDYEIKNSSNGEVSVTRIIFLAE